MSRDRVFLNPDEDEYGWSDTKTECCPVEFVRASLMPIWVNVKERLPDEDGWYLVHYMAGCALPGLHAIPFRNGEWPRKTTHPEWITHWLDKLLPIPEIDR